jgi:hypothetical protein
MSHAKEQGGNAPQENAFARFLAPPRRSVGRLIFPAALLAVWIAILLILYFRVVYPVHHVPESDRVTLVS